MKNLFAYLFLLSFILVACGEDKTEDIDDSVYNYEYYPLGVGYEWQYKIDSFYVSNGGNVKYNSTSYLKEEITKLISDDGVLRTYEITRSKRTDENNAWNVTDRWITSKDNERVTRTEENIRFIKMVFPAKESVNWDGNVFFDSEKEYSAGADVLPIYEGWNYKIESIDGVLNIGTDLYTNVMHISHIDRENLIKRNLSEEFYQKGTGLIERTMEFFESQSGDPTLTWKEKAQAGFMVHQVLVSFKKS